MRFLMISMVAFAALAYTLVMMYYPRPMLNPGDLTQAHTGMDQDCFACHTAFRGIPADKCIKCHRVDRIGLFKVDDTPLGTVRNKPAFHQLLQTQDCMACHTDHAGRRSSSYVFSHDLITGSLRNECVQCHTKPADRIHSKIPDSCALCHEINGWKPARFDHSGLKTTDRNNCITCHEKPSDALHKSFGVTCLDCHTTNAWKPATFEHDRYFSFDQDHRTECITCHAEHNYKTYTCYGCHEHTPSNIREEHLEEGIRDYERCAQCHRSGDKHQAKQGRNDRREHDKEDD